MQWAVPCVFTASVWTLVSRECFSRFKLAALCLGGWSTLGRCAVCHSRARAVESKQPMKRAEVIPARGSLARVEEMLARIHMKRWSGFTPKPAERINLAVSTGRSSPRQSPRRASAASVSGLNAARGFIKHEFRARISLNESPLSLSSLSPKHEHLAPQLSSETAKVRERSCAVIHLQRNAGDAGHRNCNFI